MATCHLQRFNIWLAETMALSDGFDDAFIMKHDMQNMLKRDIPIIIITNSLSLFDVMMTC